MSEREDLNELVAVVDASPDLILSLGTGEVVDLREPAEVAKAMDWLADTKRQIENLRRLLVGLLRAESLKQAKKTMRLGEFEVVLTGGEQVEYDTPLLMEDLEAAGLSRDRLHDAFQVTMTWKTNANVIKQIARANPEYRAIIERHTHIVEKPWNARVSK
jgi:hypothetical protein